MTQKKAKKVKSKSFKTLKNNLDVVFSEFIRLRDSDSNGMVKCCTCGRSYPWTGTREMNAGHYIPRGRMNTRWDEQNVHGQCVGCNKYRSGALHEYSAFLLNRYGRNIIDVLVSAGRQVKKWRRYELEELIDQYKEKVVRLKKKRNCALGE